VLEPERPRTQARGLQGVLQPISLSHRTDRGDTGAAQRRTRATARVLRLLPVATALQWTISDPSRRVSWNSTQTGTAALFGIATKAGYRQVFETHADKVLRSDRCQMRT